MSPKEQLNLIIDLCPKAQLVDESGQKVVFLPDMKFQAGAGESTQSLLFVPFHFSGYDSSLLFTQKLNEGPARNWTQHNLLNRKWWRPSYSVDTQLSWLDQIFQHLKAVI